MMNRLAGAAVLAAAALLVTPAARAQGVAPQSAAETLTGLHAWSDAQTEMGKLARVNSQTELVRRFGKSLVGDFQTIDGKVVDYAQRHGLVFAAPTTTTLPRFSPKQLTDETTKLNGLRGRDFDREFLATLIDGHREVIDYLGGITAQTSDKDLRKLLGRDVLPRLHGQLKRAQDIMGREFGRGGTNRR